MNSKFPCMKCGKCCTKLNLNSLYADLDSGNGVCKFFEQEKKICSIYDNRPLICRVDDYYDVYFKDKMTRDEFHQTNKAICLFWQQND